MSEADRILEEQIARLWRENNELTASLNSRQRDLDICIGTLLFLWYSGSTASDEDAEKTLRKLHWPVECPFCEKGHVLCGNCRGGDDARQPCAKCRGTGSGKCEVCDGKGSV